MPIRIEWFYYLDGYKTKLNWFLLEVALEYYTRIRSSPELGFYREQNNKGQISRYCTYYVRRMKESLLKCIHGQRKSIVLYQEHISDFYPQHSDRQNRALGKVAKEALDHMLSACKNCPVMCLHDYKSRNMDFDIYKD
jgi:ferredoxin